MSFELWLIFSTVAGPVIAVQTQKWIERATERQQTRRRIFESLMSNRATRLNDEFIRSLNLIDLVFTRKKDQRVTHAWRALFGELNNPIVNADENDARRSNDRIDDRLVHLLKEMSLVVGLSNFSDEQIRRGIYYPMGRVNLEGTQMAVLLGVRDLLQGRTALPMKVTEFPPSGDGNEEKK
ncbi:MAG TPA: DUF6680 family protein [Xanthobacteraceae bacterium]|nr:DUF6680 family protein [Xanthobacteraceae bacterium]